MGAAPSKSADEGEDVPSATGTDYQLISELAALPLYCLAFQINKIRFDAILSSDSPSRAPHWPAQRMCIAPRQRLSLVSRGQMHVTLVGRLTFSSCEIAVKRARWLANRIAAQRHRVGLKNEPAECCATLKAHDDWVTSVAFHPSGRYIATGSHDKTVKLWRLNQRCAAAECVSTLHIGKKRAFVLARGSSVAFHPSASYLAIADADGTSLWRINKECSGAKFQLRLATTPAECVFHVAFHPSAPCLVTASSHGSSIWRINTDCTAVQRASKELEDDEGGRASYSAAFHPSEPYLATGSHGICRLWQLNRDGTVVDRVLKLRGHDVFHPVHSVAFHPSALVVASGSGDGSAKLWQFNADCSDSKCLMTLEGRGGPVYSVAFHPSAVLLATGSGNGSAKLWLLNLSSGAATLVAQLQGHGGLVRAVALHPSALCLATGSDFGGVKLWQ